MALQWRAPAAQGDLLAGVHPSGDLQERLTYRAAHLEVFVDHRAVTHDAAGASDRVFGVVEFVRVAQQPVGAVNVDHKLVGECTHTALALADYTDRTAHGYLKTTSSR